MTTKAKTPSKRPRKVTATRIAGINPTDMASQQRQLHYARITIIGLEGIKNALVDAIEAMAAENAVRENASTAAWRQAAEVITDQAQELVRLNRTPWQRLVAWGKRNGILA